MSNHPRQRQPTKTTYDTADNSASPCVTPDHSVQQSTLSIPTGQQGMFCWKGETLMDCPAKSSSTPEVCWTVPGLVYV